MSKFDGQEIEIVSMRDAPKNAPSKRLVTLVTGEEVWLPNHIEFEGEFRGKYIVDHFESDYVRDGKPVTGYTLRNPQ